MTPRIAAAALLATCCAAPALAQDTQFRLAPYAWIAGFDGKIGVGDAGSGGGGGRVDVDLDGLSDNMSLAGAMLYADWRAGRWSVFGDWTYAKVESDASTSGVLYDGIDAELKGNIVQAALGYATHDDGRSRIDAFVGVRFYDLEGSLGLRPAALASRTISEDARWADAIAGVRLQSRLDEHWDLGLYGDIGTGGSDLTWQLFGSIGYRFSWGSITGGWRHLVVDYDKDKLRIDAALTGPFIGAVFRF